MVLLSYKTYIVLFLAAFVVTYLLVPLVKKLALKWGAVSLPTDRHVHQHPIPRMGGLAVAVSFYGGVGALVLWHNLVSESFFAGTWDVAALLIGGLVILALGVYDDLRDVRAKIKLLVQLLAATIVCALSGSMQLVNLPFVGVVELGLLAVPVTILWIVVITNAFNLIDGIDGLAAGVGILVFAVSFFIALTNGQVRMMVTAAIMSGALLAFLRYNFHPATVFLGDTGSQFLGFCTAVVSLQSSTKGTTAVLLLIPVCVLGYPLLDLSLAITRRVLKGKPIFSPDRSHIHHKLLACGLGQRAASGVVYVITLFFTGIALFQVQGRSAGVGIFLALLLAALAVMFNAFGYWDFIRNGLGSSMRTRFRVCNLMQQFAAAKMEEAESVDDLWELTCLVAKEFDLHTVKLSLGASACRTWENPANGNQPEEAVREFPLRKATGSLRISHSGQKDDDIRLEQNILLERMSRNLDEALARLADDSSGPVAPNPKPEL